MPKILSSSSSKIQLFHHYTRQKISDLSQIFVFTFSSAVPGKVRHLLLCACPILKNHEELLADLIGKIFRQSSSFCQNVTSKTTSSFSTVSTTHFVPEMVPVVSSGVLLQILQIRCSFYFLHLVSKSESNPLFL